MVVLFAFLLSFPLFAREGLEYLNSFPPTNSYAGIEIKAYNTQLSKIEEGFPSKSDRSVVAQLLYGHKISRWSYISMELPFIYSEEDPMRYGKLEGNSYIFRGVREPKLAYNRRFRHKVSDGDYYSDYQLGIIPGIFAKQVRGDYANAFNGSTTINALISTGAMYSEYEAKLSGEYMYNSWWRGKNTLDGGGYVNSDNWSLSAALDFQWMASSAWHFFFGSKLTYTSNTDIKTNEDNLTIQLGTGYQSRIGAKFILENSFIEAKMDFSTNDLFTDSATFGNFKGKVQENAFSLSWTKNL